MVHLTFSNKRAVDIDWRLCLRPLNYASLQKPSIDFEEASSKQVERALALAN